MADNTERLEARITELENRLNQIAPPDSGTEAVGIKPCITCIKPCVICYPCINECICGPCRICYGGGGPLGGGGFGGFGG